jgi:hypothetical protein
MNKLQKLFFCGSHIRDTKEPIIEAKALEFHKHFNEGEEQFTASIGWLDCREKRFGVRNLKITGEKLSASMEKI